jgi:hypothetical protein
MGVFDYVKHDGRRYQTKDTPDQWMHEYRIVGGRLLGDEWHTELVPKAERPYPDAADDDMMSFVGSVRVVIDKADVDQNWHGYLDLAEDEPPYRSHRAKFTDGNLVEFVCTERTDNQEAESP